MLQWRDDLTRANSHKLYRPKYRHTRLCPDDPQDWIALTQKPTIAMEVDQASTSQPEVPELPVLSLPVLQIVKDGQGLHGLKHSDYQRYRQAAIDARPPGTITPATCAHLQRRPMCRRQYCSRRLRRVYKGVKFLHGRGRYQKKKLEPEAIKDVRCLSLIHI